jgi:hypothetical protein
MIFYQNGDNVKVTTQNSTHTGKTGVVVNAYTDNNTLLVRLDETEEYVGFFKSEVEIVWVSEETKQISGIAGALKDEGVNGWTDEDYQAVAVSLYKKGVRFDV